MGDMIMSTFDYTAGPTVATRARLGVIILQSDETLEHDLRRMIPEDGVGVYASRIPNAPEVSSETLAEMAGVLTHTVVRGAMATCLHSHTWFSGIVFFIPSSWSLLSACACAFVV